MGGGPCSQGAGGGQGAPLVSVMPGARRSTSYCKVGAPLTAHKCVCVHVHVRVCVHRCMCVCAHRHVYAQVYAHVLMHVCAQVYAQCMCALGHVCARMCVHIGWCVHTGTRLLLAFPGGQCSQEASELLKLQEPAGWCSVPSPLLRGQREEDHGGERWLFLRLFCAFFGIFQLQFFPVTRLE